ncbi:hypothetical protein [Isoalcanivorax beigongshangi]|uniref:Glycosyltransferase RgtA/B/C/D-like domain-containing protein n=1 Tax=Isoalcanivorax beigongshangi TaxID=3238810 RepID=A0ABV4AHR0_9GAMM
MSGPERWWLLDLIDGANIFYGDDAYRFFLARAAWRSLDMQYYNFALPLFLLLEHLTIIVAGGELLTSRLVHAGLAVTALALLVSTGYRLGLRRGAVRAAVAVVGSVPLFVLVSLSFYGEVWLGLILVLTIWSQAHGHHKAAALLLGAMPLIRPEGIFFVIPYVLFRLMKRSWALTALCLAPGVLYLLFLLAVMPDIGDFGHWRLELREILGRIEYNAGYAWETFPYSFLLLALALPACALKVLAPLRTMVAGALLWVIFLLAQVALQLAYYEPRYLFILYPLLLLGLAAALDWLASRWRLRRTVYVAALTLLVLLLQLSHFLSITAVHVAMKEKGPGWLVERLYRGDWERVFPSYLPAYMDSNRAMADTIHQMLAADSGIDQLVVYDPALYYFLDPAQIPAHVTVGYPGVTYLVFHYMLNGQVFIQHNGERMFSYLRFGKPDFNPSERRALFVDHMPMPSYPYRWVQQDLQMYLFSYRKSFESEVRPEDIPFVAGDALEALQRGRLPD